MLLPLLRLLMCFGLLIISQLVVVSCTFVVLIVLLSEDFCRFITFPHFWTSWSDRRLLTCVNRAIVWYSDQNFFADSTHYSMSTLHICYQSPVWCRLCYAYALLASVNKNSKPNFSMPLNIASLHQNFASREAQYYDNIANQSADRVTFVDIDQCAC